MVGNIVFHKTEKQVEKFLTEGQFGFTTGRETREAIFSQRLIIEEIFKKNKYIFWVS